MMASFRGGLLCVTHLMVVVIIANVSGNEEGELCNVPTTTSTGNRTSSERCSTGCCEQEDGTMACCKDPWKLTQSMIYGIVVTACIVVLALGLYIRLRTFTSLKHPQWRLRTLTSQADLGHEPSQGMTAALEEADLPPPYWMCVGDAPPPPDVVVTSSTVTSPPHRSGVQSPGMVCPVSRGVVQSPHPSPSQDDHPPSYQSLLPVFTSVNSTDAVSSSESSTRVSQGVVMQPSTLSGSALEASFTSRQSS